MPRMDLDRLRDERAEVEAELGKHEERHQRRAEQQQSRLDDLHPGRCDHPAEGDVDDHEHAHHDDGPEIGQPEKQFDQLSRADHLRDQIERNHNQRAGRRHGAHGRRLEPVGHNVGEGETAEVAQRLGHQEHDERPADEEADRIDEAVIAGGIDERRDAEERGRGHIVARDGEAVLEARDPAAGGVEVLGRARVSRRPIGDGERHEDEGDEDDDGVPVGRLDLARFDRAGCQSRAGRERQAGREGGGAKDASHHFLLTVVAALTIALVRSS